MQVTTIDVAWDTEDKTKAINNAHVLAVVLQGMKEVSEVTLGETREEE